MRRCTREGVDWPHLLDLPDDPLEQRAWLHAGRRRREGLTVNQGFANGPLVTPSLCEYLHPAPPRWVPTSAGALAQWVVLKRPSDADAAYLVRRWEVGPGATLVACEAHGAGSLRAARALLPHGLVCLGRAEHDDPVIAEVWV
ncbi:MAG: hypothetical protein JWM10_2743 [Myxococcaceae bacterium]|nr:hypothetical protein [Myxococcaceae bacterium]